MSNTIIGYGKMLFDPGDFSDPKIEAIVAPVNEAHKPDADKAKILTLNVKDLFKAKPGMIFEQSFMLNEPSQRVSKTHIHFNTQSCRVERIGNIKRFQKLFGRYDNNAFRQLRYMYAVTGQTQSGKAFAVPCPVVAIYYLPHTKLLAAAFAATPLVSRDDLYDPTLSNLNSDKPSIHIRYGVNHKIARHLAKYILDPQTAGAVFDQIHPRSMHVFKDREYFDEPSLYMDIPARGELRWKVNAIKTKQLIWVTQILDCDSPAPYEGLYISHEQRILEGEGKFKHIDKPRKRARADELGAVFMPGQKTDIQLETLELIDDDSEEIRYSGLDKSKVKLITRIHYQLMDKTVKSFNEPIEPVRLGTGERTPDGTAITPVEFVAKEHFTYEQIDEALQKATKIQSLFESAVNSISADYEDFNLIQLPNTKPSTPPFNANIFPFTKSLNSSPWCRRFLIKEETPQDALIKWQESARRFYLARFIRHSITLYIVGFILFDTHSDNSAILVFGDAPDHTDKDILNEILGYATDRSNWPLKASDSISPFKYRKKKHHPPIVRLQKPTFYTNADQTVESESLKTDENHPFKNPEHLMRVKLVNIIHEFMKKYDE